MSQAAPDSQIPRLSLPITTRRLLIRDYTTDDIAAVFDYVKDPVYWQYQRSEAPTAEQIKTLIEWVVREQSAAPSLFSCRSAS